MGAAVVQELGDALSDVAFGEAPEVEPHAFEAEAHRFRALIKLEFVASDEG